MNAPPDHESGDPLYAPALRESAAIALRHMSGALLVVTPVLLLVLLVTGRPLAELASVGAVLASTVAARALFARGQRELAIHGLITTILFVTLAAIVSVGSIRSVGTAALAGTLAVAAVLVRGRVLAVYTTFCIVALGALTWAEATGRMQPASLAVGVPHWAIHATVFVALVVTIHHARRLLLEAVGRLQEELLYRERMDTTLRRQQHQLARVFQVAPVAMSITRMSDGRYLEVNDAILNLTGYGREDMVGVSSLALGLWAFPEQRAELVRMLQAKETVRDFQAQLRHRDGRLVDVHLSADTLDVGGEPCALVAIVNVTEQKRSHELLLEIARGVSTGTGEAFFRSMVVHLQRATQASFVLVGETTASEVQALAVWREGALVPNYRYPLDSGGGASERATAAGNELRADLRDASGAVVGLLLVQGSSVATEGAALHDAFHIFAARAQAEILRMRHERQVLGFQDVLERRVTERTGELQRAIHELESFSYSVSHDLRAPLRAITGYTSLVHETAEDRLTPDENRMLDRVVANVNRMDELVNALLSLSRVSRQSLLRRSVDLSAMARDIGEDLAGRGHAHAPELAVEPGLTAHADAELLRIVLENLLGNAWKFTANTKRPRIEVGLAKDTIRGEAFFVRDNGAGFDPQFHERLFKPFNRLHAANEFPGTGIGLATVLRIVERHGGHAWAESRPGLGATFYFNLPKRP
jgi:PAS domain S-box-containing protein